MDIIIQNNNEEKSFKKLKDYVMSGHNYFSIGNGCNLSTQDIYKRKTPCKIKNNESTKISKL